VCSHNDRPRAQCVPARNRESVRRKAGKTGTNYPISADDYRLFAIRVCTSAPTKRIDLESNNLGWHDHQRQCHQHDSWMADTWSISDARHPGWRFSMERPDSFAAVHPAFQAPFDIAIDCRLVTVNPSCADR
jgi:hypothetical protein